MSILLICPENYARNWKKALKKRLPNTNIYIFPEIESPESVEYIVCWKPDKHVFNQFPHLKVVQSLGAGVENITRTNTIPPNAVLSRIVDNNLANDMWEYALTATLYFIKNLNRYRNQQQAKVWRQKRYRRIQDTQVSILGLGQIGALIAKNFAQMGFQVKGWSNSLKTILNVETFVGLDGLSPCLDQANVLINVLPLTTATEGILNKKNLQQLKEGACLINVGRGGHLVEKDLLELLDNDFLNCAFLDVFSLEPLPESHVFWKHPKVTITPHVASLTDLNSAAEQIVENYQRFKNGEKLLHLVSIEKGY